MTISSELSRLSAPAAWTGAALAVDFAFKVFATSHVQVYKTDTGTGAQELLAETTDYTVTLATPPAVGGTVNLLSAVTGAYTVQVVRDVDYLQELDLSPGPYYPEAVETAIDKLTTQLQQLQDQVNRCLKVSASEASATAYGTAETRKGLLAAFDGAGNPIAGDPGDYGALTAIGAYRVPANNSPASALPSPTLVDDLAILASGSTTRRTLAQRHADVAWVDDYGAKGDGATLDTSAIQAALNSGKKLVAFRPGATYRSGTVAVPDGVTLAGNGATFGPTASPGLTLGSGVRVRDLHFSNIGSAATCMFMNTGVFDEDVVVENCHSVGAAGNLIGVTGASPMDETAVKDADQGVGRLVIRGCSAKAGLKPAIELTRCYGVLIEGCYIDNCYDVSLADNLRMSAIRLSDCVGVSIVGCFIMNQGVDQPDAPVHCIMLNSSTRRVAITGCVTYNSGGNGVTINDTVSHVAVVGNTFSYGRFGEGVTVHGDATNKAQFVTIAGNHIHGRGREPTAADDVGSVYLIAGVPSLLSGIFLDNARHVTVSGNVISYCTRGVHVSFGCVGVSVHGNLVSESSGFGVAFERAQRGVVRNNHIRNPCREKNNPLFAALADTDKSALVLGLSGVAGAVGVEVSDNYIHDENNLLETLIRDASTAGASGLIGRNPLAIVTKPAGFRAYRATAKLGAGLDLLPEAKTGRRVFSATNGSFLKVLMGSDSSCTVRVRIHEKTAAGGDHMREVVYLIDCPASTPTVSSVSVFTAGVATAVVGTAIAVATVTFSISGNTGVTAVEVDVSPLLVEDVELL